MFMGVPYVPFFFGSGTGLLLAMYLNFWFLASIPAIVLVMRQMARRDEMIFRLLALRLRFKSLVRNTQEHDGMWSFTPNAYRDHPRSGKSR